MRWWSPIRSGRPNFGLLQNRINLTTTADIERAAKTWPAQLMLFDILRAQRPVDDQEAVRGAPGSPGGPGQTRQGLAGPGAADLRRQSRLRRWRPARSCGWKAWWPSRLNSIYQPGRRAQTWLKIKNHLAQEVVIGGWRPGQGRRDGGVGSLLMGVPTADGLRYIGRVGSGFNDRQLDEIQAMLERLARKTAR